MQQAQHALAFRAAKTVRSSLILRFASAIAIVLLLQQSGRGATEPETLAAFRAGLGARANQLQNLQAELESQTNYTPLIDIPNVVKGVISTHKRFSFLHGRALFEATLTPDSLAVERTKGAGAELRLNVRAFSFDRFENFGDTIDSAHPKGLIADKGEVPHDAALDLALGLRLIRASNWDGPDIAHLPLHQDAHGHVIGQLTTPEGRKHEWTWTSPALPLLNSYVFKGSDGTPVQQVTSTDFREVQGVMLPHRIEYSLFAKSGAELRTVRVTSCTVTKYVINDPTNNEGRYHIAWPPGTIVLDSRIGFSFIATAGAPKSVSDQEIYTRSVESLRALDTDVNRPATLPSSARPLAATAHDASPSLFRGASGSLALLSASLLACCVLALVVLGRKARRRRSERGAGRDV